MKKVLFKDFLERLSNELPEVVFNWYSTVHKYPTDVLFTVVRLRGKRMHILTEKAQGPYGATRTLPNVPQSREVVDRISLDRRLVPKEKYGPMITVSTYI